MENFTSGALESWKRFCAGILFCALIAITSSAQTFTSLAELNSTDGEGPEALALGTDGNFYGVTWDGGSHGGGTIFRVTPEGTVTTVYDFCSQLACEDGMNPVWLMLGSDGSLYGTTSQGGDVTCNAGSGCGVVFKLNAGGVFAVLYAFPLGSGARPSGLIEGIDGNFYGVSNSGGAHDYGSVFELTPAGQLTVLYSFCAESKCADGSFPSSTLVQSANGTLYGATETGGAHGDGTIYMIAANGTFTTLNSFSGKDGSSPVSLIQAADGDLYGITNDGGAKGECPYSFGCGTIFRIAGNGQFATVYNFCSQSNCTDGISPTALMQASDGNLYGAAGLGPIVSCGGFNFGCGTLFEFTSAGTLNTLHTFNDTDGDDPNVLLQDTSGGFYGVTEGGGLDEPQCGGGNSGCGTVFNLVTGLGPFVTFTRNFGRVGQTGEILGRGLTGTTAVSLNGTAASFTVVSDTLIRATVPMGATSGLVTIETPSGPLTSNTMFRVIE
jgi:uncharacterized repeat protein (TIGR03803 family)